MWERSHMTEATIVFSVLLISFRINPRSENKDFWGTARRRGKAWKAKAAAPTQQSTGLDAKPSTQSPHMLLWPATLVRLKSLSPPPPQGVFVRATPVIYSFNDKTQPSTHSSPESKNNPIRADNRDGNQTGAGSSDTDVDLHKSQKYCQRLLFFHCRAKKYTKLWTECRERISQFTVATESSTISSQPPGFNGGSNTPAGCQGQRFRKDFVSSSSSHAPFSLGCSCFFFVDLHINLIAKYWHSFFAVVFFFLQCVSYLCNEFLTVSLASISLGWSTAHTEVRVSQIRQSGSKVKLGASRRHGWTPWTS